MVPFCGVFLKELSDALDGTASIISLKPSPDPAEGSVEVSQTHTKLHMHIDQTSAVTTSTSSFLQFVSDYSGQHNFVSRSGSNGLHVPEKEATVSNILQIIRYTVSLC